MFRFSLPFQAIFALPLPVGNTKLCTSYPRLQATNQKPKAKNQRSTRQPCIFRLQSLPCSQSQRSNQLSKRGSHISTPLIPSPLSLIGGYLHNSVFPVFLHKCDSQRYWPLGSPSMPNPWVCRGVLRGHDPRPPRLGSRSLPIPRRIHASLGLDGCSRKVRAEPWAWFVDGWLIGGVEGKRMETRS